MASRNTIEEQFAFLICCVHNAHNGKPDFAAVAGQRDIVSKGAAAKRFERLLKAYDTTPKKKNRKSHLTPAELARRKAVEIEGPAGDDAEGLGASDQDYSSGGSGRRGRRVKHEASSVHIKPEYMMGGDGAADGLDGVLGRYGMEGNDGTGLSTGLNTPIPAGTFSGGFNAPIEHGVPGISSMFAVADAERYSSPQDGQHDIQGKMARVSVDETAPRSLKRTSSAVGGEVAMDITD